MKRKLIELHQEYSIVCDNKRCGYKIKNETGDPNVDISGYLNSPCPNCGENLLTEEDYSNSIRALRFINWVNKWFSWINIFIPKMVKRDRFLVHIHNGVKIEKKSGVE